MGFMDEHVLERISAVETALQALDRRLDALTDTVERVAASNFIDHTMIETLTDTIESAGVNLANLELEWRKRLDSRLTESDALERLAARIDRIIGFYEGPEPRPFRERLETAYEDLASDRVPDAMVSLAAAFEKDPANYDLGMLLAELAFCADNAPEAIRRLRQVLESRPDHFEATLLMGFLEGAGGRRGPAEQLLRTALELREDSPSAHAALGALFLDRGDRASAARHLHRALELKPAAETHFMLGAVYYHSGQQRRAIDQLKEATRLDPGFGEAFYQLGLLCREIKWMKKAGEFFDEAQRLSPLEPRYRRQVGGFSETSATAGPIGGLLSEELRLEGGWMTRREAGTEGGLALGQASGTRKM
jgi:tetratricopeptide (TPR) repeat protein